MRMGQRSQLFVVLPERFIKNDNRLTRIKVYHNQWLYGFNFIKYLARLLKSIEHLNKKDVYDFESNVDKAILHCNNADIDCLTNTRLYDDDKHNYNIDLVEAK